MLQSMHATIINYQLLMNRGRKWKTIILLNVVFFFLSVKSVKKIETFEIYIENELIV